MTNEQFDRLQAARDRMEQARRAFAQNPTPALASVIKRIARVIRRESLQRWHVEITDTYGGDANYCWVRRFSLMACSQRGAAIVAGKHSGYSGRLHCVGTYGDGARYDVRGAAVCLFISSPHDADEKEMAGYPLINGKGSQK